MSPRAPAVVLLLLAAAPLGCGSSNDAASPAGSSNGGSNSGGDSSATGGAGGADHGGSSISRSGGSSSGGASPIDGGAPCAFRVAPSVPVPAAANATPEEKAAAAELVTLDALIGRYLRGDVTVYRGTAKAADNASALANTEVYGPRPDGVIPEGPAIALLDVRPTRGTDYDPQRQSATGTTALLVLHALPADKHVILVQPDSDPGLTEVSLLSGVATTASLVTSCMNCGPDLAARPDTLSFSDLTGTGVVTVLMGYAGQGGKEVDVTATATVSAELEKAPVCSLRWEDLVVLNSATGPNEIGLTMTSFEKSGTEMVWHTAGSFPAGGTYPCPLVQQYTIDVFVDLTDLGHYGTRNFVAGTPTQQCVPATP